MHHGLRAALIMLTGTGATLVHEASADLALSLLIACVGLSLTRRCRLPGPARAQGALRAVRQIDWVRARADRARARWGAAAWTDATTVPGACLLASLAALVAAGPGARDLDCFAVQAGLAALPLFFDVTRHSLPPTAGARLLALQRVRRGLPAGLPARVRLRVRASGPTHHAAEAEIDVRPQRAAQGLARLRLTHGHGDWMGRPQTRLQWSAVVQSGSEAERLLSEALPQARRRTERSGRWVALEAVAQDPGHELRVLLAWIATEAGAAQPPLANAA
jgi:hypothetical protein